MQETSSLDMKEHLPLQFFEGNDTAADDVILPSTRTAFPLEPSSTTTNDDDDDDLNDFKDPIGWNNTQKYTYIHLEAHTTRHQQQHQQHRHKNEFRIIASGETNEMAALAPVGMSFIFVCPILITAIYIYLKKRAQQLVRRFQCQPDEYVYPEDTFTNWNEVIIQSDQSESDRYVRWINRNSSFQSANSAATHETNSKRPMERIPSHVGFNWNADDTSLSNDGNASNGSSSVLSRTMMGGMMIPELIKAPQAVHKQRRHDVQGFVPETPALIRVELPTVRV